MWLVVDIVAGRICSSPRRCRGGSLGRISVSKHVSKDEESNEMRQALVEAQCDSDEQRGGCKHEEITNIDQLQAQIVEAHSQVAVELGPCDGRDQPQNAHHQMSPLDGVSLALGYTRGVRSDHAKHENAGLNEAVEDAHSDNEFGTATSRQ
jgi:hypothetical protein